MSTGGYIGIALAYVGLAVLLFSVVAGTRWPRALKGALVVLVGALSVVSLQALPAVLGWPATAELPSRFALIASHVQEPDKVSGRAGAIFLWADDLADGTDATAPRAYRLPFSPGLNAAVAAAGDMLRKGQAQIGERLPPAAASRPGQRVDSPIAFFDVPDASFPAQ